MLECQWFPFSALTTNQLYSILALRSDIFVVEQNCAYPDVDGRDTHAMHLLGNLNEEVAAYLRLFPSESPSDHITFGRLLVAKKYRRQSYGIQLMETLLAYCEQNYSHTPIECSAQYYLKSFYEKFGFQTHGDIYDEDGIPHIKMIRNPA